jgi:N-acetylglucosamine-6-phosphate deacetylase
VVAGRLVPGDVGIDDDGRIDAVGLPPARGGRVAVPGLVDLQVNGYAGVDLLTSDLDGWRCASRALAADGVAWFLPTLITSEPAATRAALATSAALAERPSRGGARSLGTHLEGPFLSPSKTGTHPAQLLRAPDEPLLRELLSAGPVTAVTLAPELPGALALLDVLVERGVVVSLGHSAATAEQAHAAFDRGARTVTHLFNAMSTPTARAAGVAGAALSRNDVLVQVVCDGVHLAADVIRLVRLAAGHRVALVTDAIAAAGMGDGDVRLGDVQVRVRAGEARRTDGTLAGSVTTLLGALQHYVAAGAALEEAVAAASARPAALLGADIAQLRPGDAADVVVLDEGLHVLDVLFGGRAVAQR